MVRNALLLVVMLAAACGSEKTDAFARMAKHAQPEFLALQESAQVVLYTLGTTEGSSRAIVDACLKQRSHLKTLSELDFKDRLLGQPPAFTVTDMARDILDGEGHYCRRDETGNIADLDQCSRWCSESWTFLALSIERFRGDALAHGVSVRPLVFGP